MGVRCAVGDGDHNQHVGIMTIGAESFAAVQNPVFSFAHRRHTGAARIRARRGLGQSPGPDVFAGRQLRDIFLLLLFRSGQKNVIGT